VLAVDYLQLLGQHLRLQAAARDQIEAANEVIDVWKAFGNHLK
jgi:uncharacterized membrane protein YebE (DUF533 family)